MCGIVGIVGSEARDASVIERMTGLLQHRGPDSQGTWTSETAHLGHTRLSILDLSRAGAQPMRDQGQVIVYNGEVYNFRHLRQELPGPFRSESDTEVVLRGFKALGPDIVTRLHGMFAFGIWDEETEELFLVRDRFGIKPLYYRPTDGGLAFASEVGPLLELGWPPIDPGTLRDYLTYGYIPTPKTPWQGIFKLPAAHFLHWRAGTAGEVSIQRYWQLEPQPCGPSFDEAAREAERLIQTAVTESAVSDVPLGLFLSGGVDSATLAAFSSPSILAFTLRQPEKHRDESEEAARLCEYLGLQHLVLSAQDVDLSEALETVVTAFGEPFGDSAALSVWLLSRLVREHVKVALSGEGGDELFYGYRWHGRAMTERASRMSALLAKLAPPLTKLGRSSERRSLEGLERYAAFVGTFTPAQVQRLAGPAMEGGSFEADPLWHLRRYWRDDLPLQQCLQFVDFHTYLPDDLLTKVDRASMAWSLEVRPPLLDHRLAELAVSLAPEIHRDPATDQSKRLVRKVVRGHLPEGYLDRPKKGFNLAIARWVQKHPELWRGALRRLKTHGWIRVPRLLDLTNDQVWALLVLDRWLARHDAGYGDAGYGDAGYGD